MRSNVVESLIVDLLLGTPIINKYNRGIFPADSDLVPWYSQPSDIIVPDTKIPNVVNVTKDTEKSLSTVLTVEGRYSHVVVFKAVMLTVDTHPSVLLTSSMSVRVTQAYMLRKV